MFLSSMSNMEMNFSCEASAVGTLMGESDILSSWVEPLSLRSCSMKPTSHEVCLRRDDSS